MYHATIYLCCGALLSAEPLVEGRWLESKLVHLRSGPVREWSDFPEHAQLQRIEKTFTAPGNSREWTLLIRQQDVKQLWRLTLNGKALGELMRDENDLVMAFAVPQGAVAAGDNILRIEAASAAPATSDDVRIGQIRLIPRPRGEVLGESTLLVDVIDADTHQPLPCRLTILNSDGALQALGTTSTDELAVRPGVAYLAHGRAALDLPAGDYSVFAGRGFEYSLAQSRVKLTKSSREQIQLTLRREVPTNGYVACDTHVHTLTHSGHGDATLAERLVTIAGEGIELPIATDHNVHIDYEPLARRMGVREHFTPVIGNEVTTGRGHFNIFPVRSDALPPDHRQQTWRATFEAIERTASPSIAVLNHARDLHSGVRPFGPKLFNAAVGECREDWPALLNAMEVVNSGAIQSDVLRLFHDWMALLNRGRMITPVGSSDSHDVARHFVGQGRTYIRGDDRHPGQLDTAALVESFQAGHVLVSYGLLCELTVNGQARSGDQASTSAADWDVAVRVLGPHWVRADRVLLFENGELLHEVAVPTDPGQVMPTGVKWRGSWRIPKRPHDVHLVAIALGPGVQELFWPTAKPYQPLSSEWHSHVIGCSGAVWLDNDDDGERTSARATAERLVPGNSSTLDAVIQSLARCDAAIAAQAAHLLQQWDPAPTPDEIQQAIKAASPAVRSGFQRYLAARRAAELAPSEAAP